MFMSRAPSKDFAYLEDKIEAKLSGWRSKCLSWAGRRALINSVALSILISTMSSFFIPNKVCNRMDGLIRRFSWKPTNMKADFWLGNLGIVYTAQEVMVAWGLKNPNS